MLKILQRLYNAVSMKKNVDVKKSWENIFFNEYFLFKTKN